MRHVLAALVVLTAVVPTARAESLAELLVTVGANARFETPARADVRIDAGGAEGRAILLGRGDTLYVEVRDGLRALLRGREVVLASGAKPPGPPALGASNVLLEDLAVFGPAALTFPQISDDGPAGVVVTGAPAGGSAWALLVHTIDRGRRAIVKTQYYQGTVSNLVKIRRDGGLVQVGGHWRPTEITVESFGEGRRTRLALAWRETPDAPARLFEPAGLAQPSGLAWP
jgi:hypothetical protein